MTNKKLIQIIVICVVAVWVFCITFMIGVAKVRKQESTTVPQQTLATNNSYESQATQVPDSTQSSTTPTESQAIIATETSNTEVSESTQASQPSEQPTEQPATQPQSTIPSGKGEIIQAYVQAVNKLKSESNFSLVKVDNLSVSISEMSPSSAMNMANKMIQNNSNSDPETFNFSNGSDAATGMSPNNVIAPLGKSAALSESIVTNATATPNGDGGYTVNLTLGNETQTLDSPAPNYSTSMEVIELASLGLPSNAKFESLTITYDNSTIEAVINSEGRITSMKHFLNVSNAEGSGSMVVPIKAKLNGNFSTTYQISY